MSPRDSILEKYPTNCDDLIKGCWKWLESRCEDDNAENLWRVHENLYDLEKFAKKHPGGREWIELTKGTDVTEAFEAHHIRYEIASKVLQKFFVREAKSPRNYRFTYDEEGFYKTLRGKVEAKLPTLDRSDLWKSKIILDFSVFFFFFASIFSVRVEEIWMRNFLIFVAAFFAACLQGISHNFIHQRNNFRMYASNFLLIGWRNWRVFHAMVKN